MFLFVKGIGGKVDAYICLSLAMIIVGSAVVLGKMIVMQFPVFLASGLRFAIASAIIWPIIRTKEKDKAPMISRRDWYIFTLMAFFGQFVFTVLMLIGLKFTRAMEAGLITSTTPAFMAAVSFLLLKEPLNVRKIGGVCLATFGVVVVNGLLPQFQQFSGSGIGGNLLICGAVAGEALFLLLAKKLSVQVSNLRITGILSFLGLLMFLPFSLVEAFSFSFTAVSFRGWLYISYFGAVYTVAAYLLWFRGVAKVPGSTAGVSTALMPVSATVLSAVFLAEEITASHVLGIVCVVVSIIIISLQKPKAD